MLPSKQLLRRIPFAPGLYKYWRDRREKSALESKDAADIFTEIYSSNAWHGKESVSGTGSSIDQTKAVAAELPRLLDQVNATSMLDIPCGDFHWMQNVPLWSVDYTGADIVDELVQKNNDSYATDGIRFSRINILEDSLPEVDVIFCRDCLVHFSFADVWRALQNICNSGSKYLLTTTFTGRDRNEDIATGQWRVLNLETAPFNLPPPAELIREGCTEDFESFSDKALGLWPIAELARHLDLPVDTGRFSRRPK